MALSRPGGLSRLFFRAPILLYSAHAGWLLGQRFLLLQHRGRKSGKQRRTVIEVIGRRRETDAYYVAAAWAPQADWYRNILSDPHVRISVGRRRFPAVARALPPDESRVLLQDYADKHERTARGLARMLGKSPEELIETTHVVEFRRQPLA